MTRQFLSSSAILITAFSILGAGFFDPVDGFQIPVIRPTGNSRLVTTSTRLDAVQQHQLSRRDVVTTSSSLVTAAATMMLIVAGVPADVRAADRPPATVSSFQGVYQDPMHPLGYRVLMGELNGKGTMTLQDEPDDKVYTIPITSKVDTRTGRVTLTIDFSVKGGPKDVEAILNVLESRPIDKATGLTFADGNRWRRAGGVIGIYSDGFNPSYRRIIRKVGGTELVCDLINGDPKKTVQVKGQSFLIGPGNTVTFDFPGKPGDKGTFDSTKNTISFADGNVWTKI